MDKPKSINVTATIWLKNAIQNSGHQSMRNHYIKATTELGYSFYVVNQKRGRCYYQAKIITIPSWILNAEDKEYRYYYLSHELAHVFAGAEYKEWKHGIRFMEVFARICPETLHKYEVEYKPRLAKTMGFNL